MSVGLFSSSPSDFVLYNMLKWSKSAFCFQWQPGPAASPSGAGAWWSLGQHGECFCMATTTALLLWQLCTPKVYVGGRGSCSFCGGQHCAEVTTDKAWGFQGWTLASESHVCEKLSILPVLCSNLLWNQERKWTTKLQRLEPVPVVPLANSFLPQAVKNNAALPLPLTNSNHFYKQILRANKNILEVLKCWFS